MPESGGATVNGSGSRHKHLSFIGIWPIYQTRLDLSEGRYEKDFNFDAVHECVARRVHHRHLRTDPLPL